MTSSVCCGRRDSRHRAVGVRTGVRLASDRVATATQRPSIPSLSGQTTDRGIAVDFSVFSCERPGPSGRVFRASCLMAVLIFLSVLFLYNSVGLGCIWRVVLSFGYDLVWRRRPLSSLDRVSFPLRLPSQSSGDEKITLSSRLSLDCNTSLSNTVRAATDSRLLGPNPT
jgi:hypothetical protein